ncbi:SusC/RagA family TonB-linked outer membrane protein [Zhouia spongiae]|uniref:SusC/RagA family TonB-linked outer membrane protein n=1 Tax=Zhouia spongiae TaxID=2202721 RepID=A0ABY3YL59_9FLAO|nr:SusC/RagA family TonB-linked outer membrane protein [Zhouia spongiae]UNY98350.1 SusC/RagA family TonB-linked outer membrane protein [Zhouia spongiae]
MKNNTLNKGRILLLLALFVTLLLLTYSAFGQTNNLYNQQHRVSGIVTDTDGIPIPGVHVLISGTQTGTFTNTKGSYTISAHPTDVLSFSFVGFDTVEETVGNRIEVNITLNASVTDLGAVTVNAGYYTVSEKERTGSISSVKAADIEKQPVNNVLGALQGRMPGVYIQQNSGVPGGGFTVRIRGQNSISSGNDPLYIIDGVPFISETLSTIGLDIVSGASPLSSMNPSDIKSIEVLKDADATAIYGSRGANGVVLITTKKGNVGKTKVDLNIQSGIGRVANWVDLLNTTEYLEMRREAFANDGVEPTEFNAPDLLVWNTNRNIDWQDKVFGSTAYTNNAQLSVSGGNRQTQFSVRGGYYKETTVFPGDHDYNRYSLNSNINHRSDNERFKVSLATMFSVEDNNLFKSDISSDAMLLPPNTPELIDQEGNLVFYEEFTNPFTYTKQQFNANTKNFNANTLLSYKILPELEVKTSIGYTSMWRDELQLFPQSSLNPVSSAVASTEAGKATMESWIVEPQLEYSKEFKNSKLKVLLGTTFQETTRDLMVTEASGFSSDALLENLSAASQVNIVRFDYSQYKYNAIFGRINYSIKDRYIINLTGRRDGSSRFGPGNQFANFGAAGVAWLFSDEPFIEKSLPFLSFGKLRASYGITGNDRIGDYEYLDTYSTTDYPYQGNVGLYPTRLFNPDFAWEKNKKLEAALQLGFLNDRILLGTTYYRNRSDNQLVGLPLPGSTGFTSIRANLPALVENSGWEFELNTINIQRNNLNWSTSVNLSIPDNKLLEYPDLESSVYANIYELNRSLSLQRKLHISGVNPQTGAYEFEDVNNDGAISSPDDYRSIYELTQEFFGGIQNSLAFKNWQVDIFFQFVKQTGFKYTHFFAPGFMYNQPAYVMNRWQNIGEQTNVQRFTQSYTDAGIAYYNAQRTDYVYGDTSFVRLKNVSLSYNLPYQGKAFENVKIYMQGQNLFTITGYNGLDPETQGFSLPPLQRFTIGMQLTF